MLQQRTINKLEPKTQAVCGGLSLIPALQDAELPHLLCI